jgi:hypothetical protein
MEWNGPAHPPRQYVNPFPLPTVEEQLTSIVEDQRETLYICPNAWALRHRFVDCETGELRRARCDSWHCLYCGPRKVDLWRQLVKAAAPTHFVTLTKVGKTVEEAARLLTTVVQRLRRGFKSQDPTRKGYREAYPIEYFAVLERHHDFEENGFHWHLLVKGVEFLPNQVVSDALRSATGGRSYITKTEGIYNEAAVDYVTKYLTKHIRDGEKGVRHEAREMVVLGVDENGKPVQEKQVQTVEVVSKARRIRYSRRFFPASVTELRARLFADIDEAGGIAIDGATTPPPSAETPEIDMSGEQEGPHRPSWALIEREPFTNSVREYSRRKQEALREVIVDRREGGKRLNRRILTMWNYQFQELYRVSEMDGKS